MPEWAIYAVAVVAGYLAGSIPFGLVLVKAAGLGDIREIGSKSIGATNVLRTGRKDLALATLLLDSLKAGLVALAFTLIAGREAGMVAGAAAFLGHCYPIWLKFKGGKGVATLMGIVLALHWPSGIVFAIVWLGLLGTLRISSVAGMAAAISAPVSAAVMNRFNLVLLLVVLALIVLWKHRENIERLLAGTEPRIGRQNG